MAVRAFDCFWPAIFWNKALLILLVLSVPHFVTNVRTVDNLNSTSIDDEISETLQFLEEGKTKIVFSEKYRKVVLVLGITGSGKSTFVQWLAGDNDKLISKNIAEGEYALKDGNRIGDSLYESRTVFPELVVDPKTDIAYYDCPGFSDTRGISKDIASTFFIKKVAEHAKFVKMLFLIPYPFVRIGMDKQGFSELLRHSTEFLKDVKKFSDSIALVVTKVDNLIFEKPDGTLERESDGSVIQKIASFLREYKQELPQNKENANAIKFIDILLQKSGKEYPKIGIFRSPNKAGPLSDIPLLQKGKIPINNIIETLAFADNEAADFGYTISDKSRKNMDGLVEKITDRVWQDMKTIDKEVITFYQEIISKMSHKINSFATATDSIDANMTEATEFATKYNSDCRVMSELVKKVTSITTVKNLAEKLNNTMRILQISTCKASVLSIENQANYLEFLQSMSDSKLAPTEWKKWKRFLQEIVDTLFGSKQKIVDDANNAVRDVVKGVKMTVSEIAIELWQVKQNQMQTMEIQALPALLDQDYSIIQNMIRELSKMDKIANTEQLATTISKNVVLLAADTEEINSKTLSIFTRSKYLIYLQIFCNHQLNIWSQHWSAQFNQTGTFIFQSAQWYRFLNDLFSKLGEYEFQKSPSRFNVNNLANWGKGQNKTQGIQIRKQNFEEFMNKIDHFNITQYDAIKNMPILDWQFEELNQLLSLTLKDNKILYEGPKSGKFVVKGYYVKFSDFVHDVQKDLCLNNGKFKIINVFAVNTVFIDCDLNAMDNKLKLTIVAPIWKIIGNRTIILDGSPGLPHNMTKANNGKYPGNAGEAGKPGFPGNSAGTFFGIGKAFFNENNLMITANGGVGGAGQNGGDGQPGEEGKNAEEPLSDCTILGIHVLTNFTKNKAIGLGQSATIVLDDNYYYYEINATNGTAGGDGGDGGTGGIGGKPGDIKLFNLDTKLKINLIANQSNGIDGFGGDGKNGGKNGNKMHAKCTYTDYIFFKIYRVVNSKTLEANTSAISGKNGMNGTNRNGIEESESAAIIQHPANRVNDYKKFSRENLNGENNRFTRNSIMRFMDKLDSDKQVKDSYDALTLAGELEDLEEQFRSLQNEEDLIHFYQSLLNRIFNYAKSPKPTENSDQYKKLFISLFAVTLGKLQNLKSGPETNLIIDMEEYLELAQENIDILSKLNKEHNEFEIVKEYKSKYEDKIKKQIEEAQQFIEIEVTPEFDKISAKIDEQIDLLVEDTKKLQNEAQRNKTKLIEKREELKTQLQLRGILNVLKVVGQTASFLGPYGMVFTAVAGTATSIAEGFLLDDQTSEQKAFNLPSSIKDNVKLLETDVKAATDKWVKGYKDKIDAVTKELKSVPELNDLTIRLQSIKDSLPASNDSTVQFSNLIDILKKSDQKVNSELEAKEKELKAKKDTADERSEIAIKAVKIASKFSQLSSTGLEFYSKIKIDAAKIQALDETLKQSEEQLQKIDGYKQMIYNTTWPALQQLRNDLTEIRSKLGKKSRVALDVTKWKVQSMLKDLKLNMQKMTKDMKVEDDLGRCIEKLDEAMTIIIKIYDRIQSYQQQGQLVNFMANIHSPQSNRINMTDTELSAALSRIEILIRSNVVLQQYKTATTALKQMVFPYAHQYLKIFPMSSKLDLNSTIKSNLSELIFEIVGKLENIKSEVIKDRISRRKYDESSFDHVQFNSNQECVSPFYVWTNEKHRKMIEKLLSGESVSLKADVRESNVDKDAIKFNFIEVIFKTHNQTMQADLDAKLKNFRISAVHLGNSYYRYDGKFYVLNNEKVNLEYTFAKDEHGRPMEPNKEYDKIKAGNLMLSPFAMWQIQLFKRFNYNTSEDFQELAMYSKVIDIELSGSGSYVLSKAFRKARFGQIEDNLHVDHYYNEYQETEIDTEVIEQYRQQQLNIAHRRKLCASFTADQVEFTN